ncbi:MAG TPA: hypothetical protein PLO37_07215 [Candidatus Hydrogenedentes bacterium]|mgnify:CR=1 FL=1|nr:hypothetical protein [Candidatus Hydrogenedentota bacterium]HPG66620.1 hypothetical protein [Candidatus Hydrogenedentota bacterium]
MRPRYRGLAQDAASVLILGAVACAACAPFLFRDRVPLSGESLFRAAPWEEARPEGLKDVSAAHPEHVREFYPWYRLIAAAGEARELPLWNPLEGCGLPLLALWRSRCLSPFTVPFYFVHDPIKALRISVLLKILVAGWCAYYAARKLGSAPPVSLFVAACFQLGGPVFLQGAQPMADAAAWFPLWLVFIERIVVGQTKAWPLGALIVALVTLGGDPGTLTATVFFGITSLVVRIALARKHPEAPAAGALAFAAAVVVGLLLAAVQLVPFLEFLRQADSAGSAHSAALHVRDLLSWFVPGTLRDMPENAQAAGLLHLGLVPLFLLPLWLAVRRFIPVFLRHRVEGLLVSAILMTGVALAIGAWCPIKAPLGFLHADAFLVGNALSVALLGAAAVEQWLELDPDECRAAIPRAFLFWLATLVVCIGLAAFCVSPQGFSWPGMLRNAILLIFFAFLVLIILAITTFRPNVYIIGYSLTALTCLSLQLAFGHVLPQSSAEDFFPSTPSIMALERTGERLCGTSDLKDWPLSGNGIPQVYCPSGFTLNRYVAFMEQAEANPLLLRRTGARALLLRKEDIAGPFAKLRSQLGIEEVFPAGAALFGHLGAHPRARVAYEGESIEQFDASRLTPDGAPMFEAVVPRNAPAVSDPEVAIEDPKQSNRVLVRVESEKPGVLVLADAWYPGWKARVDSVDAEVFPVDGLFRGVSIPAGHLDVEFYFAPRALELGLIVTVAAAIAIVVGLTGLLSSVLRARSRSRIAT